MVISEEQRGTLLAIARQSIVRQLQGETAHEPPTSDDLVLNMPAGCFVTLHDRASKRLRGCIGRLQTADPLIKSIHETAQSVLQDPRFRYDPITLDELPRLELEISVLSPLEPAAHPLDFDPLNDGIYLMCNGRAGTFLPQVAKETGWGREQLLGRLCTEKMGFAADAWRSADARLQKYRVVVIGPVPFIESARRTEEAKTDQSTGNGSFFGPNQVFKI